MRVKKHGGVRGAVDGLPGKIFGIRRIFSPEIPLKQVASCLVVACFFYEPARVARLPPARTPPLTRGSVTLEREAKEAKAGLWADADPAPPWEWRKR